MTKTDTEANGADKEHSSPVPCYQPYFVGYRVCDVLKSKIGEIVKIDGSRCLVDWGMYDTWEKADNLYCEESYYEDDEQDFS